MTVSGRVVERQHTWVRCFWVCSLLCNMYVAFGWIMLGWIGMDTTALRTH